MLSVLTTHANEKSTYVISVTFTDDSGAACAPTTLQWTLTDSSGTVVNDRSDVVVESPSSVTYIVLYGNDLDPTSDAVRYLLVEGTYNSDRGSDLPFTAQVMFVIDDFVTM